MAKTIQITQEEYQALQQVLAERQATASLATQKPTTTPGLYQGEPLVNEVRIGGVRATKSGNGVMVNFNSTKGKQNYFRFVPTELKARLTVDAAYPVTAHTSKASGNLSHAIWLSAVGGGKVAVYCAAK